MRNVIASTLVILAALAMTVMGTAGTFGLFLIIPVSFSSTALALALLELFGTKGRSRENGSVRLHISGANPSDQHLGRTSDLRRRNASALHN